MSGLSCVGRRRWSCSGKHSQAVAPEDNELSMRVSIFKTTATNSSLLSHTPGTGPQHGISHPKDKHKRVQRTHSIMAGDECSGLAQSFARLRKVGRAKVKRDDSNQMLPPSRRPSSMLLRG